MCYLRAVSDPKPAVLITGANGFVGSRLCRKLSAEGFHVVAGVRRTADLTLLKDVAVEYRYGDVTQPDTLPAMLAGIEYVVHNAGVTKSRTREGYFAVNEHGAWNLLEAALIHCPRLKRVVYISSVAAMGPSSPGSRLTESDTPHPVTTYGESKLAGEKTALSFAGSLPVVAVRPPGVYGPGDKEIFAMFQAVHRHVRPHLGKMCRRLQLVHVDDLCHGIFRALVADVRPGSTYFIAEQQSYSMREMIRVVAAAVGRWGFPLILPTPLFWLLAFLSEYAFKAVGATPMLTREKVRELNSSWEMDTSKAQRELDFTARIDFSTGVRQTYDWYIKEGWL
jgi:nucleoside-diphosphate-sugar epimerase